MDGGGSSKWIVPILCWLVLITNQNFAGSVAERAGAQQAESLVEDPDIQGFVGSPISMSSQVHFATNLRSVFQEDAIPSLPDSTGLPFVYIISHQLMLLV